MIRRVVAPMLVAGLLAFAAPATADAFAPPQFVSPQIGPPLIARPPAGASATGSLVGTTADDGAKVIARKWLNPRTVDIVVRSPAVGRDLPVRVIVPVGWSASATKTWPLLMALHGGAADYTSWTRNTDLQRLSRPWNVLIAMPEAGRTGAYTDYVQNTRQGPLKWETFHTTELIQILSRGFRASSARAVVGVSAGGYGALHYSARHPGLFRYAASFSGALGINQFPLKQANIVGDQIQGVGFARYGMPGRDQRNWTAHDPFALTGKLRGTGLYVYSGLGVVPWSPIQLAEALVGRQNQAFVSLLRRDQVPVTSHFAPGGGHNWTAWRAELHRAWPHLTTALKASH